MTGNCGGSSRSLEIAVAHALAADRAGVADFRSSAEVTKTGPAQFAIEEIDGFSAESR